MKAETLNKFVLKIRKEQAKGSWCCLNELQPPQRAPELYNGTSHPTLCQWVESLWAEPLQTMCTSVNHPFLHPSIHLSIPAWWGATKLWNHGLQEANIADLHGFIWDRCYQSNLPFMQCTFWYCLTWKIYIRMKKSGDTTSWTLALELGFWRVSVSLQLDQVKVGVKHDTGT